MEKWILVGTTFIRKMLLSGSVKANGVVLNDIVTQLDTTNSLVAWAFALQNGIAFLISPFVMALLKYFTERQVCIVGGVLSGFGYIYCGLMMNSVLQLFIGLSLSGVGFGLSVIPAFYALQYHFGPNELPLIMSSTGLFDYIGVAFLPLIMQYFRSEYGMKTAMILFGAIAWNIITCGIASKRPERKIKGPDHQPNQETNRRLEEGSEITKDKKGIKAILSELGSLFQHKNIGILLIVEFNAYYVFTSWAIFLVSLGKTLGLSDQDSAFLSTAGGLGGFIGRIIAFALFKIKRVDAMTSTIIPCLITGMTFVFITMSTNFILIILLVFISGLTQGLNSSCIFAQMPGMVCPYHYRQIIVFECLSCGLGTQISGLFSGLIQDLTGSAIYVYLFNAMLTFAMVPLGVWWAIDPEPNMKCDKSLG